MSFKVLTLKRFMGFVTQKEIKVIKPPPQSLLPRLAVFKLLKINKKYI